MTDQYGCPVLSNAFTLHDIELAPDAPVVSDQYIPRNTPATITVKNPRKGRYDLLDNDTYNASVLATSVTGVLQTPPIPDDETLFVGFTRGDCASAITPVHIKVFDSVKLYVPNAFTPNNDGVNDRWHIVVRGLVKSIHIAVFDRWGSEVYSSTAADAYWDGAAGGHPLSGTFVYLIVGKDYFNQPIKLSGTLLIIR